MTMNQVAQQLRKMGTHQQIMEALEAMKKATAGTVTR